ncbi:hypothetical protein RvY_15421 [Ramazzottius varieornatus]|uniref:THAP-type domain-containing protein n=1 Tax=Ramazzottius varieornatus TaxID=947166 RepID=A0A1D1VY53_RAMVA|nr:hypothetical protein RvY_15421 [Ramazzottius varieornatus]
MILASIMAERRGSAAQVTAARPLMSTLGESSTLPVASPASPEPASAPDIVVKIEQPKTRKRKRKPHGVDCAVAHCPHYFFRTGSEYVHFHKFPSNDHLRSIWVKLCQRKDMPNPKNARICSDHFKPEDYRELTKAGTPRERAHLKTESVPSQFYCLFKTVQANLPPEQLHYKKLKVTEGMEGSFENATCWVSDCGYGITPNVAVKRFVYFRAKGTPDYFAWLRALPREARSGTAIPETLQICEAHFLEKDMTRSLECSVDQQGKIVHTILPPVLSPGALPTEPFKPLDIFPPAGKIGEPAKATELFSSFQSFHKKVMGEFLKWKQPGPRTHDLITPLMQRWKLEVADSLPAVVFYQTEMIPRFRVVCTIEFQGTFQPRMTAGEKELPRGEAVCSWSELKSLLLKPNIIPSKFHS